MLGDLFDGIAAIEHYTFFAVDIADLQFATRRQGEPGIIGKHPGLGIELADIDNRRPKCSGLHRHLDGGIANAKGTGRRAHGDLFLKQEFVNLSFSGLRDTRPGLKTGFIPRRQFAAR